MLNLFQFLRFPTFNIDNETILRTHKRFRRQTLAIPVAASECIFADGGKTNPVREFMSFQEDGLTCRAGQIMLESSVGGLPLFCCRYSSTSKLTEIDVPKIYASRCVFEGEEILMWSALTPGNDLECKDQENYELVSQEVTHLVTGNRVIMSCCKKKEPTTTTVATSLYYDFIIMI